MIGICAEEAMELISAAIRRIGEREFTDQTRRSAKSTGVPITISIKSLLMELGITGETFMRNKASLKTEYENIARLLMDRNQKAEDYFIEGIAHIENGEQKLRTFDAVAESIIKSIPQNEQKLSDILLPIEPMSGLNRTEFGYEVADDSAKRQMFEASSSVSAKSFKIDLVFDESAVGKEHYDFSAENLPIASKRTVVIDGNTKEVVEYGIPTIKVTDDYMRRITSSMEDARARIKANKSIGVSTPEISRAIKADEILLRRESLRLLQMYREREKLSAFRHDFFENIKVDKGFRSSVEVFGTTGGRVIKARGKDESGWGQMKLTTAFGKKADKVELFHVSMASNQFVSVDESGTNVAGAPSFEVGKVYTRIQYNDQSGEKRFMYIPLQTGTLTDNRDVDNTINFLLGSLVGRQNPEALKLVLDTVFVTGHDYRPIKMDKAYKSEDTGIKYCNTTLDEVASLVESGILGSTEWSNGMYDENLMTQTIRASKEGGRVSITWRDSSTTTRKPKGSAGVFKTMEIVPRSDASGTIYEVSVFNHFDMRTDFGDGTKLSDSQMSSIVSTPVGVITDGTVVKGSLFEKKSVEMTEVELEQLLLNHGMWKDMKRNIN